MSRHDRLVAVATGLLLIGAALLAGTSAMDHFDGRPRSATSAGLRRVATSPPPAPPLRRSPHRFGPISVDRRATTAGHVIRLFLHGWLGCIYHRTSCAQIAGSLPAYGAAIAQQRGSSLATPAELATRPRILSIDLLASCPTAELALANYQDGEGGQFQLHVNLVREPAGWRVFDVAEAPPHIPLPKPLTDGPRGC